MVKLVDASGGLSIGGASAVPSEAGNVAEQFFKGGASAMNNGTDTFPKGTVFVQNIRTGEILEVKPYMVYLTDMYAPISFEEIPVPVEGSANYADEMKEYSTFAESYSKLTGKTATSADKSRVDEAIAKAYEQKLRVANLQQALDEQQKANEELEQQVQQLRVAQAKAEALKQELGGGKPAPIAPPTVAG